MPSVGEVISVALSNRADAPAAIDAILGHRRDVARRLLSSTDTEPVLAQSLGEVAGISGWAFPWDPIAEDYHLQHAILDRWTAPAPPLNVLMAAMAFAPAHHFPIPPSLSLAPAWLRPVYVRFLLGRPPIFLHPGEADRYAAHCTLAMATMRAAIFDEQLPDSAEIAKLASSSDSAMMYFNAQSLRGYFRDKAQCLEWLMLRQGYALGHTFSLAANDAPKVGILHRSLAPGTETYYLLAHLEGRDKKAAAVTVYLLDAAPSPLAEVIRPWVSEIVALPADVPAAVARIRQDSLDFCLLTNNVTYARTPETEIAAHRLARVQVASGGSPVTTGLSSSDLFMSSEMNDPHPNAQDDYEEGLVRLPGTVAYFGFAHDHEPRTIACSRADLGVVDGQVAFFSAANYYKITPELLTCWAEILARTPDSILVLMPFNPNWGASYPEALFHRRLGRALESFGVAPSRVRVVGKVPTRADLHAVMSLADIYLDSFPFPGSCSLIDPLLIGLPVVARDGDRLRTVVAASMLRMEGLDRAICASANAYIERAVRLARDPTFRAAEADAVRNAATPSLYIMRTEPYAEKFAAFCTDVAAISALHLQALRGESAAALRDRVVGQAKVALALPSPAFRRFVDTDLVIQLLVPYLQTLVGADGRGGRVLDVGACVGSHSLPFLRAGFRVDMFEPDPECAGTLAALGKQFPELAVHQAQAVVWEAVDEVRFNKRSPGLSGLGESVFGQTREQITVSATTFDRYLADQPGEVDVIKIDAEGSDFDILAAINLAAVAPKVIMVEFSIEFPQQSQATLEGAIATMQAQGYDAVVFEYRKGQGFGVSNWEIELVDVALDASRIGGVGDGLGNVLFYRRDDTIFLACLASLLEVSGPARTRPVFQALTAQGHRSP
jgi:FkbM family methyltransferase